MSELGSVVTRTAVPLLALLVLGAGPTQMALLVVAGSLAILLVGFLAGAWVDRLRRRPILIATDAVRSLLLLSIPIAYAAGVLRIEQLYVVTFVEGALGALFNAAYPAYVPSLIGVDRVVDGNSKLATSSSLAEIGGPGLAGALVQLVSAPFAILIDALSFAVSAVSLLLIRTPEPARPARTASTAIRHEIVEGLRLVRHHQVLFPIAMRSVVAARRRIVLRRPLHDLPHQRPAPDAVPARRRHLGRRRGFAGRLALRGACHPRAWGSGPH